VGSVQPVIDRLVAQGGAREVDYVHGDEVLEQLAQREGCVGLHFPAVAKGELLRRVVHAGPLPRKTFSMGEADEKRFYIEARRIR
jgi:DNA-binding transcriptional regulator LsrR (DeoR family)